MTQQAGQNIRHLKIRNIARIAEIEVEPPATGIIQVAGENASGKTSLLKAVIAGLGGEVPAVRDGQEHGEVELETETLRVNLVVTEKSNRMTVTAKQSGEHLKSPKGLMRELFGKRTFDSSDFLLARPKAQVEQLLQSVTIPIDKSRVIEICEARVDLDGVAEPVALINNAHEQITNERRVVNREAKRLQGLVDSYATVSDMETVDLEGLYALKEKAMRKLHLQERIERQCETVAYIAKQLEEEGQALDKLENEEAELGAYRLSEIEEEIEAAKQQNRDAFRCSEKKSAIADLHKQTHESGALTSILSAIADYKNEVMQAVQMPVAGLDVRAGQVYYQGHPLAAASGAEQMRVALGIAAAEIPDAGIQALFVLDPPQLDGQSWQLLAEFAAEKGLQLWVAKVEDDPQADGREGAKICLHEGRLK